MVECPISNRDNECGGAGQGDAIDNEITKSAFAR
jgi:hypothetical protein